MSHTARPLQRSVNWIALLIALAILIASQSNILVGPQSVRAAALCTQWADDWTSSSSVYAQNNVWGGDPNWTQCTNTVSSTNWSISGSNHAKALNGAPASYPSSVIGCHSRDLNPTSYQKCTTGWQHHQASQITGLTANWTFNSITTGAWNAPFDIWYGDTAGTYNDLEVMIWFNHLGSIQPIGSVIASNVSIDGTLWNVWSGTGGPGGNPAISWDVISYVRVTKYNGGNINLLPFQTDALNRSARADNNSWLTGLDVGFEIWQGGNGLGTTAFSVNKTVSSGPTNTPTTAPAPTATPTTGGGGGGSLKVQYKASNSIPGDGTIAPHLQIVNNGTTSVAMSALKLRYYFTKDVGSTLAFACDYAGPGCGNISGSFVAMSPTQTGADTYLELTFGSGAGSISANGGSSGEIQARVTNSTWDNFNETGDYSFDSTKSAFADWDKVVLLNGSTVVWGTAPGGGGSPTNTPVPPTATRTNTPVGPTNTPVPPTATRTSTPIGPTNTPVPPTATPTPGSGGGSCNSTNATLITVGFTKDGAGTFCWKISSLGYINSWNMTSLTVNGTSFTNLWASSGQLPAQNGGYWYIAYDTTNSSGHFEAKP